MTPEQKKTLLEMSMLMRKNKEKGETENFEVLPSEVVPLEPAVGKVEMLEKKPAVIRNEGLSDAQKRELRDLASELVSALRDVGCGDFESFCRFIAESDVDTYHKLKPYFKNAYNSATDSDVERADADKIYRSIDKEIRDERLRLQKQKMVAMLNKKAKVNVLARAAIKRVDSPFFPGIEEGEMDIVNLINAIMSLKDVDDYSDAVLMDSCRFNSEEMTAWEMLEFCRNLKDDAEEVVYNLETEGVTSDTLYPLIKASPWEPESFATYSHLDP